MGKNFLDTLMKRYKNVYALSWLNNSDKGLPNGDPRLKDLEGLYDGETGQAIVEGQYYLYLGHIQNRINYYLTGRELRPIFVKDSKQFVSSAYGEKTPIFGGYVDSHMGHFLIEVLARGIDFQEYQNHPVVFLLYRQRRDLSIFYKYCEFFGLEKERIVIVRTPTLFPELYIPRPQFYITSERINQIGASTYEYENTSLPSDHVPAEYFSNQFLEIHRSKGDEICQVENTKNKILYLSRVKIKERQLFGERIIHDILKANGHHVICPEEHTWEYVISEVRKHSHIVGRVGTAMHFLLFCREKKKVTYFNVKDKLFHNFHNLEQMMQNDAQYIQVKTCSLLKGHSTNNLFMYSELVKLLQAIGIKVVPTKYKKYYEKKIIKKYHDFWRKREQVS